MRYVSFAIALLAILGACSSTGEAPEEMVVAPDQAASWINEYCEASWVAEESRRDDPSGHQAASMRRDQAETRILSAVTDREHGPIIGRAMRAQAASFDARHEDLSRKLAAAQASSAPEARVKVLILDRDLSRLQIGQGALSSIHSRMPTSVKTIASGEGK